MLALLLAVFGCRNKDYSYDSAGVVDESDLDGDGFTVEDGDCDDEDVAVNPDSTEICDGLDNDCDGETDEAGGTVWYEDADGDGFGGTVEQPSCEQPSGFVDNDLDCDDALGSVNPDASELCNGVDDDCDGETDEDASDALSFYDDVDGDGYGDPESVVTTCDMPSGYVTDASDCDDQDHEVNPAADELCDGVDNDCDGELDEDDALDTATWYADADADGYGDPAVSTQACEQPTGFVGNDEDCDDGADSLSPAAEELCDEIDNDCDGSTDEDALDAITWYADADEDGFGDASVSLDSCEQPSGYGTDATDCDDSDADTHPAADEYCDGHDDDCDGDVDEDSAVDAETWYADVDADGYGDPSSTAASCSQPSGYEADASDCDDSDADVNPGETEVCNGVDDDCDGDTDEELIGSGEDCPGESCLDVLEEGSPTGSDDYWIDPDGAGAYEEYCDYGTVGSGWSRRLELTVTNATGAALSEEWVELELDTASLIASGYLEDDGADLRLFTHDGPLLEYWIETLELDSATTTVWVYVDELDTGDTDFTVTYGNSGTERRSLSWWFDGFDTDTSALYDTEYGWGSPSWAWDTASSTIGTDSTNVDFYMWPSDLSLGDTVYVEVEAWMHDDDAVGVALYDSSVGYVSGVISDDYDGANHNGGDECIVLNSSLPTNHYQGSQQLDLGNLVSASSSQAVGLYWDGADLHYVLNGSDEGDVTLLAAPTLAGIGAFAAQGSPGAEADYLWVGPEPIDFDPDDMSSSSSAATGSESAF
jgi:hypothetical protein